MSVSLSGRQDTESWRCEGAEPFCLGMADMCGCGGGAENVPPNEKTAPTSSPKPKKVRLSLQKPRFERVSDEDMSTICKGYVPPNTAKNTKWSVTVFNEWKSARNNGAGEEKCPDNVLERPDVTKLNFWLSRFVAEVRRSDNEPYPPKSIHQLLCGILRFMRSIDPACPNFLDRSDTRFRDFHGSCEVIFRRLHQSGVGTVVRHTPVFSIDEEGVLWSSGVLSVDNPKGLQRAVFYYVGKVFCLRGGDEQKNLKPSQFVRSQQPDRYVYTEHGSKNRSGGLGQLNVENKQVTGYATPDNQPRCIVFLLDKYFLKLPKYAFEKDVFYLRPKQRGSDSPATPWYDAVPVGKNKLSKMVQEICSDAGISKKTNHSLRATGAASLFKANVPEKIIQTTTGHRSIDALRVYERVSEDQRKVASRILTAGDQNTDFNTELSRVQVQQTSSKVDSPLSSVFGQLHGCTIGTINVNVLPSKHTSSSATCEQLRND